MRKVLILLVCLPLFAAACGSDSGSSTPVKLTGNTTNKGTKDLSGTEIDLELDDFYFSPTFIKGGSPGTTVTVKLENEGSQDHTFTSTAFGLDEVVKAGESKSVQVKLPQSGATEFHCRFHQSTNGMQGAFFFKDGDTLAAGGTPAPASSSSSSSSNGGYDYN